MEESVYAVVDDTKVSSLRGKCHDTTSTDMSYSMKTNEVYSITKVKEMPHENTADTAINNMKSNNSIITDKKVYTCLFATIILLLCIVFLFLVVAFTEISKLKSEAPTPSPTLSTTRRSSLEQLIMQLNENFSSFSEQLYRDLSAINNTTIMQLNELYRDLSTINNTIQTRISFEDLGQSSVFPAPSCAAVLSINPSSSSGYYWVISSNDSAVRVYCDMTRSCGNITGGWTRVASLDMRDNSTQCPSDLRENITDGTTIRTCVNPNTLASCSSDIFSTYNLHYSNVCGRIRAYQFGTTDAFRPNSQLIDNIYVDGVSLTHGSPRQHIWTFAAALNDDGTSLSSVCPCFTVSGSSFPPSFVGDDYFCDTGSTARYQFIFHSDDPLWDGDGCGGPNMCCSFNNPPWFYRRLPQSTTDNIEMRVCRDEPAFSEDVAIEIIDIYVQ